MPRKAILPIVLILILAAGAAVYFFVLRDAGDSGEAKLYNYAVEDPFVTNVRDSQKLFKATVVLVATEKGLEEFFETKQYIVRDTILFILRDLTEEDIRSSDIQDRLRVTIPQALNKALEAESIVSVYFSDFVMQ